MMSIGDVYVVSGVGGFNLLLYTDIYFTTIQKSFLLFKYCFYISACSLQVSLQPSAGEQHPGQGTSRREEEVGQTQLRGPHAEGPGLPAPWAGGRGLQSHSRLPAAEPGGDHRARRVGSNEGHPLHEVCWEVGKFFQ